MFIDVTSLEQCFVDQMRKGRKEPTLPVDRVVRAIIDLESCGNIIFLFKIRLKSTPHFF